MYSLNQLLNKHNIVHTDNLDINFTIHPNAMQFDDVRKIDEICLKIYSAFLTQNYRKFLRTLYLYLVKISKEIKVPLESLVRIVLQVDHEDDLTVKAVLENYLMDLEIKEKFNAELNGDSFTEEKRQFKLDLFKSSRFGDNIEEYIIDDYLKFHELNS